MRPDNTTARRNLPVGGNERRNLAAFQVERAA